MITPPDVKQMYDEISKENKEREPSKKKGDGKGKNVDDDDIVVVDEEKEEKNGKRKEVTKKSLPEKKIAKSGSEFSSEGSDEEEEEEEVKESKETTRRMSQRLSTSGTRSSTSAKSGMSSTDLNKRNEHVTTPIAPSKKQVLKKNPALSSDQEPSPQDQLKSMQSKLLTPIYRIDQRTTAIEETGEDIKTALASVGLG